MLTKSSRYLEVSLNKFVFTFTNSRDFYGHKLCSTDSGLILKFL